MTWPYNEPKFSYSSKLCVKLEFSMEILKKKGDGELKRNFNKSQQSHK